ncbi:MAG: hypothetical protein GX238_03760 [Epulopiscium sp.]|nr:hypothetical protein [Candidatus Epulonipiscium sp.]
MYKDSKTISASEVNQFTYCAYQWYYTRLYGPSTLRQLARERNEKYEYHDVTQSRFSKGNRFHSSYHFWYRVKRAFILLFIWLVVLFCIYFIMQVMQHG